MKWKKCRLLWAVGRRIGLALPQQPLKQPALEFDKVQAAFWGLFLAAFFFTLAPLFQQCAFEFQQLAAFAPKMP
ncbi:MAG: hypothetical protein ACFN26_06330, partial [Kingella denitrificans]